jgi:hypothetical protein
MNAPLRRRVKTVRVYQSRQIGLLRATVGQELQKLHDDGGFVHQENIVIR